MTAAGKTPGMPPQFDPDKVSESVEVATTDKVAPPDLTLDLVSVQYSALRLGRNYGKCIAEAAKHNRADAVEYFRKRLQDLVEYLEKESDRVEEDLRVLFADDDDLGGGPGPGTIVTPPPRGRGSGGGQQ